MSFQLDTSGFVVMPKLHASSPPITTIRWSDLTPFMQGYVEAGVEDIEWPDPAEGFGPSSPVVGFDWFAPATLSAMMSDCAEEVARWASPHLATGHNGGEFWEARQTGTFTGARAHLQPITLYLGEDGLIHHRVAS